MLFLFIPKAQRILDQINVYPELSKLSFAKDHRKNYLRYNFQFVVYLRWSMLLIATSWTSICDASLTSYAASRKHTISPHIPR